MSSERREGPEDGEGEVLELRKDEANILISSCLDKDEVLASLGQKGKRRRVKCEDPRVADRRITRSQAAKLGEETQANRKIVQALRANQNGESSDICEGTQCEEIGTSKKTNLRSDVAKDNGDSHQNIERKSCLRSGIAKQKEEIGDGADQSAANSFGTITNGMEHMQYEEEGKVGELKNLMSDDAKQGEKADMIEDATKDVNPTAGTNSTLDTRNRPDEIEYREAIKVGTGRVLESVIVEQGKDSKCHKEKVAENPALGAVRNENCSALNDRLQTLCEEGGKLEHKKTKNSDVEMSSDETGNQMMEVKERDADGTDSKFGSNGRELTQSAENTKVENMRILRSTATKAIQEADRVKNKVLEVPTPVGCFKEKITAIGKRKGTEHMIIEEDIKVQKKGNVSSDTVSTKEIVIGSVLKRKTAGRASIDETTTKRIKKDEDEGNGHILSSDLKNTTRRKADLLNSARRSDQRMTLKMLKNNAASSSLLNRKRFGISNHERANSERNRGAPKKNLKLPSAAHQRKSRKMLPAVSLSKSRLKVDGHSPEKKRCHGTKAKFESLGSQVKPESSDLSTAETSCSSESFLLVKQRMEAAGMGRGIIKQKISDQIKIMLLNAGWKIDLRPRRGRSYEDSVYISPQGSGYWSITKAYDVYQRSFSCRDGDMVKVPENIDDTKSSFVPIPVEVLSLFKRIVVNKRRHRKELKEHEEHEKRSMIEGKSRKAKESITIKRSKSKRSSANIGEAKVRRKASGNAEKYMVGSSAQQPDFLRGKIRNKQRGYTLLVRNINQQAEADTDVYVPYPWRRTIFSWLIDLGVFPVNAKATYMNVENKETMLEGRITRDGILCSCCSEVLSASSFEFHAGGELCQSYKNIFVEEVGMSLLQCQLNAWDRLEESERKGFYHIDIDGDDPNDDTCGVCGDGGDLICCDGCPSTFHLSCLDIKMLPPGCWQCMNCSCGFCGLVSRSAACESREVAPPLLSCFQCENKYHQHCAPENYAIPIDSGSGCISFCGQSCQKLFKQLQKLLGVKNDLDAEFSWTLLQRFDEKSSNKVCALDQRAECNSKIAIAHAVMDECFRPIIDQRSGINLIHNVVYSCGSNFIRLNYRGFYTLVLEERGEVISTACLRIHGTRLAEMPFIGTRYMYRRQGMCRRLLNAIESALCSLNVEKLIIPAIPELRETWTKVLGFKPLGVSEEEELRAINILVFPGTGLLQKHLLEQESADHSKHSDEGYEVEPQSKHNYALGLSDESLISSPRPKDHASDVNIVQVEKHEDKDAHNIPPSGSCINSNASPDSLDTYHGFESQAQTNKSYDHSPHDATLERFPSADAVSHDECTARAEFQVDNSVESTDIVPSEGDICDTLVRHKSEAKCISQGAIACTLSDSGVKTIADLLDTDNTVLQQHIEAHCTYSGYKTSVPQNSDCAVGSLEPKLNATRSSRLEAPGKSGIFIPAEDNLQDNELTVDEVKAQVAVLKSRANFYIFAAENGIVHGS